MPEHTPYLIPGDVGPHNRALRILGYGAADLQQELVVRIAAHRLIEEHDLGAVPLQLLDQEHLVHVVARQPVRLGDQDAVEPGARGGVAQTVEAGPPQAGAAVTVVAKDALGRQDPTLTLGMGAQTVELLLSGLRLGLAQGRYSGVDGYMHDGSPPVRPSEGPPQQRPRPASLGAAGTLDPIAAAPPNGRPGAVPPSTAVAS